MLKVARRRVGLVAAWLVIGCIAALTARAALQFDVFPGYDGIVPEANWFPVVCEIKNEGASFNGVVEIAAASYNEGQVQRLVVELPSGTLKRVVIPVFCKTRFRSSWTVRLLDERGKVRGEHLVEPRRQLNWGTPLLGGLARTATGTPVLRPIARKQPELQPASARFLAPIFPDNPLVLEGMNALYLSSDKAIELQVGQVNALMAWLHAGGHLIVGIEQVSDVAAAPWLANLLPCTPREFRTVERHHELQQWLRTPASPGLASPTDGQRATSLRRTATPENPFADVSDDSEFELANLEVVIGDNRDGRTVVAAGDTPLIVTASRGLGRITVLAFSPEREPVRSWKNLPSFWARLADVPGHLYVESGQAYSSATSADGIFGAMIDSRQVRKLPAGWLLVLLLVYLLVIGPLDQYWLKRIGRPMLTWITFPCYVALFSLLIYFIGYKLRAGESEWNELHVVDVLVNGERAELRGRTFASVYSPVNQRYLLESQQKYATFRAEYFGGGFGGQGGERMDVMQVGDNFRAEIFVPVWTSQLFVSDWWQSAPLPLKLKLAPQGNGWRATVENRSAQKLTHARLVIDDQIIDLGELPAKQTKTISIGPGQGTPLREFVTTHGHNFQTAVQQRQHVLGHSTGGRISDLPNGSMAASFLSHLARSEWQPAFVSPAGLDLSRAVERGNAVLLAWAPDEAPIKPFYKFTPRRSARHTLWRVVTSPEL